MFAPKSPPPPTPTNPRQQRILSERPCARREICRKHNHAACSGISPPSTRSVPSIPIPAFHKSHDACSTRALPRGILFLAINRAGVRGKVEESASNESTEESKTKHSRSFLENDHQPYHLIVPFIKHFYSTQVDLHRLRRHSSRVLRVKVFPQFRNLFIGAVVGTAKFSSALRFTGGRNASLRMKSKSISSLIGLVIEFQTPNAVL